MDRRLGPLLARQHGVVSRTQAVQVGLHPHALAAQVRARRLAVAHRGVYVVPGREAELASRATAAVLAAGPGAVCSGLLAAELYALPVLEPAPPEVTVPLRSGARNRHTLRVRRRDLPPSAVTQVGGIAATSVQQTILDLLTEASRAQAIVACDAALRRGAVRREDIDDALALPARRARPARDRLALADARSESPLETLLRLVLVDAGLGPFELQAEVDDGNGVVARLDLFHRASRVAIEADGRAAHSAPAALYRDRHRQNMLQQLGIVVLRFTWYDVTRHPEEVVAQVRRALRERGPAGRRLTA